MMLLRSKNGVGFHFHRKTVVRFLTAGASSLFVALMFAFPAREFHNRGHLLGEKLYIFLAVFFFCAIGTAISLVMLLRVVRGDLVLEFTENEIIDRRFLRIIRVPYEKIEIFSPPVADLVQPSIEMQTVRAELEMSEYVMVMCRLKPGHGIRGPGIHADMYTFSDHVRPLSIEGEGSAHELKRQLSLLLEGGKIAHFEQLFEVEIEIEDESKET